ncbi:MAG: UDP-glucose dehydrogenase family protein [Promethearchaeota archaeon]
MKRISFLGTGFIGLVGAACFAERGFEVIASSHSSKKIDMINSCKAPFYEADLEGMLNRVVPNKKLRGVIGREEAVLNTDVSFITVGTPMRADNSADLQFIERTAIDIGKALKKKNDFHVVVTRSTVPPGTTRNLVKNLVEEYSGKKAGEGFGLCMNPEFLREGQAVYDTLKPDRVVIGSHDKKSAEILENVYKEMYKDNPALPFLHTTLENAEMVKYGANCLLAAKISYANEIANICEKLPGVDIDLVMEGVGLDWRINPRFLKAGAGWGGSCFPKDTNALASFARSIGYNPIFIQAIIDVNEWQSKHIVNIAEKELEDLSGKEIAILGLSFKPETDDMRDAPSLRIIKHLLERNASVKAYDPVAMDNAKRILENSITFSSSPAECLSGTDCCILVTEWEEFASISLDDFKRMKGNLIIDGRRHLSRDLSGFKYVGIGLGSPLLE